MRGKAGSAAFVILLAASACSSGGTSTGAVPKTPATVGPRASSSEVTRAAALVKKAIAHVAKGRSDLAKGEFEAAIKHDANNKFGWYNLGVIANNAKEMRQAKVDYQKAITIDPHFDAALYNYGLAMLSEGDLDQAVTYLDLAVRANDKNAAAHWNLGLALAQRNNGTDSKRSTVELNKGLKLDPSLVKGGVSSSSTTAP